MKQSTEDNQLQVEIHKKQMENKTRINVVSKVFIKCEGFILIHEFSNTEFQFELFLGVKLAKVIRWRLNSNSMYRVTFRMYIPNFKWNIKIYGKKSKNFLVETWNPADQTTSGCKVGQINPIMMKLKLDVLFNYRMYIPNFTLISQIM